MKNKNIFKEFKATIEKYGLKIEKYDFMVATPNFSTDATKYYVVDPENGRKITYVFEPAMPFREDHLTNALKEIEKYMLEKNFDTPKAFLDWLDLEAEYKGRQI